MRCKYRYHVVAGAARYGRPDGYATLKAAREMARACAAACLGMSMPPQFEIERSAQVGNGNRYWLQKGSRWVLWSAELPGPKERKAWYVE